MCSTILLDDFVLALCPLLSWALSQNGHLFHEATAVQSSICAILYFEYKSRCHPSFVCSISKMSKYIWGSCRFSLDSGYPKVVTTKPHKAYCNAVLRHLHYLQPRYLHPHSTLSFLACLISYLLPLLFNLRNESTKVQWVASSNDRGTFLYPAYAYQLY